MRAGLLSDPRVVVALRTLFVPVHLSALNTPHCMPDPRDVELLRSLAGPATDAFDGGEREAFVLPDGRMGRVFLSLSGSDRGEHVARAAQYTAAGRRDDDATRMFRHHGALALGEVHRELPDAWRQLWDDESPAVRAVLTEAPRWPEPAAGERGLRVFVRNGHPRYDDLHGAEVVAMAPADLGRWTDGLRGPGDRETLPPAAFAALANALVPRGTIDPQLEPSSISGELVLVAARVDGARVHGTVEGSFALRPAEKREASRRASAAILFECSGAFTGRFAWDRTAGTFAELRVVTTGTRSAWHLTPSRHDFPPHYRAALEWVDAGDRDTAAAR